VLRLEVRDFRDLTRWRWVLTDAASGAFVADHEVRLDAADWQFEVFANLPSYLRWHVAPDRRAAEEARIASEVGEWIGSQVLGPVGAALLRKRPAVVRVVVPPETVSQGAEDLLLRPLELAHVDGKPLAVQDVTLVMEAGCSASVSPVGDRLRVLGLFSLPEGKRSLNLRRERQELVRLIDGIAATGKAADVRVLQYGVTREALRDVLADGEGWDVVHISGHGRLVGCCWRRLRVRLTWWPGRTWRTCSIRGAVGSSWSPCRRAGRRRRPLVNSGGCSGCRRQETPGLMTTPGPTLSRAPLRARWRPCWPPGWGAPCSR